MTTRTLSLHRPWWQRALERLAESLAQWRTRRAEQEAVEAALGMDEQTLRDIGAPLWLVEQARVRREHCRFDRELQRVQVDPSAPRYW